MSHPAVAIRAWPLSAEINWLQANAITFGFEWEHMGDNPRWRVYARGEDWSLDKTYWTEHLAAAVTEFIHDAKGAKARAK